jgi:hypothetical protein
MALATALKTQQISEATNPKKGILDAVGDIAKIELFFDLVLVGTYIPGRKIGNIWIPDQTVGESEFQGKIGLVLKKGPTAFVDDEFIQYNGQNVNVGDWVAFFVGDAKSITVNDTPCRMLKANQIRMRIPDPRIMKVF